MLSNQMIRLNKKLLFAIEAVLDIAYNGGVSPVRSSTRPQPDPVQRTRPRLPCS